MLVTGFPAGSFQTNCWLVATGPGAEAVVVDPGQDALPGIAELCARHRLKPVAALLTHGHLDHLWTVAPLAGAHGIPAFVHPADGQVLELAGLRVTVDHTPGHTPGHVTFRLPPVGRAPVDREGAEPPRLLAGDLVFAGSIGRTDLPGGSMREMLASLATRFLTLPDETVVLPGHGPQTTVGR